MPRKAKPRLPSLAQRIAAIDECIAMMRNSYTVKRKLVFPRDGSVWLYRGLLGARATLRDLQKKGAR